MLDALVRFGRGEALCGLPALAETFSNDSGAGTADIGAAVGALVEGLAAVLAVRPLAQVPLRHSHSPVSDMLLLASAGRASLALTVWDGEALQRTCALQTVEFVPMESWIRVLGGTAEAERVRCGPDGDVSAREAVMLAPGTIVQHCGSREAIHMRGVTGQLVMLRLQRALDGDEPVRVHALEHGKVVQRIAARAEESRIELAMAAIAAMGRRDAVPALSRIADGSGPAALRWAALKTTLGLDTRAGMVLLGTLASSEDDVLVGPAQRLHAQLLGEWPELERIAQWRG